MANLRKEEVPKKVEPKIQRNKDGTYRCKCCCHGYCKLSVHTVGGTLHGVSLDNKRSEKDDVSYPNIYERDFFDSMEISNYESPAYCLTNRTASMTCSSPLRPILTWRGL